MGSDCSLVGDLIFFFRFFTFFLFLSCLWGEICSLVEDHFFLSFLYSFLFFLLSFYSESTGPLDLNYSGSFFREIANKQIGNF